MSAKVESLEGILLDPLGTDEPESSLEIVIALDPTDIGRNTPVRIFPGRCATSTEVSVGPGRPVIAEVDEHPAVFVDVLETKLLHRVRLKRTLVLLAGVNGWPARVAGAHIENEIRLEGMYPCSAVVPAL